MKMTRSKVMRRIFSPIFATVMMAFAFSAADAQLRPYGDSFRGGINVPVSVVAGQTVRIRFAVPDNGGTRANGGAHVKVFDGNSGMLYETSVSSLPGGTVHEIEIDPLALPAAADPLTGRLLLRIKVDLWLRNAVLDANSVEFPTSFELLNPETPQPILIGLLLPAVQKVR